MPRPMEVIAKPKPKSKKAKKAGKAIEKAAKAQEVAKEAQAKVNEHLEVKEVNKTKRKNVEETATEHKAKTEKAIDLLTKAKAKNTEFKATAKEYKANVKNLKAELEAAKKEQKSPQDIAAIEGNIKNAKEEFKTKEAAHKDAKDALKEELTSMNINIKKVSNYNLKKTQKTVEKKQKKAEKKTEKELNDIKTSEKSVDKELEVANKALEVASKETSTRTEQAEKLTKKVETSKSSKVEAALKKATEAIEAGETPEKIKAIIEQMGLKPAKEAKVFERVEKMQEFKTHERTVKEATELKEASTKRHRELTEASEAFEAKGKETKAAEKAEKKGEKKGKKNSKKEGKGVAEADVAEVEVKELDPVEAELTRRAEADIPKPGPKATEIEIAKYKALYKEFRENARADVEAEMTKQNAETMEGNVNAEASGVAEEAVGELPPELAEPAGKGVGDAAQKKIEEVNEPANAFQRSGFERTSMGEELAESGSSKSPEESAAVRNPSEAKAIESMSEGETGELGTSGEGLEPGSFKGKVLEEMGGIEGVADMADAGSLPGAAEKVAGAAVRVVANEAASAVGEGVEKVGNVVEKVGNVVTGAAAAASAVASGAVKLVEGKGMEAAAESASETASKVYATGNAGVEAVTGAVKEGSELAVTAAGNVAGEAAGAAVKAATKAAMASAESAVEAAEPGAGAHESAGEGAEPGAAEPGTAETAEPAAGAEVKVKENVEVNTDKPAASVEEAPAASVEKVKPAVEETTAEPSVEEAPVVEGAKLASKSKLEELEELEGESDVDAPSFEKTNLPETENLKNIAADTPLALQAQIAPAVVEVAPTSAEKASIRKVITDFRSNFKEFMENPENQKLMKDVMEQFKNLKIDPKLKKQLQELSELYKQLNEKDIQIKELEGKEKTPEIEQQIETLKTEQANIKEQMETKAKSVEVPEFTEAPVEAGKAGKADELAEAPAESESAVKSKEAKQAEEANFKEMITTKSLENSTNATVNALDLEIKAQEEMINALNKSKPTDANKQQKNKKENNLERLKSNKTLIEQTLLSADSIIQQGKNANKSNEEIEKELDEIEKTEHARLDGEIKKVNEKYAPELAEFQKQIDEIYKNNNNKKLSPGEIKEKLKAVEIIEKQKSTLELQKFEEELQIKKLKESISQNINSKKESLKEIDNSLIDAKNENAIESLKTLKAEDLNVSESTLNSVKGGTRNLLNVSKSIIESIPKSELSPEFLELHDKVTENSSNEGALERKIMNNIVQGGDSSTLHALEQQLTELQKKNKQDSATLQRLTLDVLHEKGNIVENHVERSSDSNISEEDILKSVDSLNTTLESKNIEAPEINEAVEKMNTSKSKVAELTNQLATAKATAKAKDNTETDKLKEDLQRATNEYNANIINLQKVAKSVVEQHADKLPEGTITEFDTPKPLNEQSRNELRIRPLTRLADMAEQLSYENLPQNVQLTLHTLTENAKKADKQLNSTQRYLESLKTSPLRNAEEIKKVESELETDQAIHSNASNKLNEFINNTFTPEAVEKATIRNDKYIDKTPEELAVKRAAFKLTDAYKNGDVMPEDFDMMVEDAVQSSVNNAEIAKYGKNLTDTDIDRFNPEQAKEYLEFMGASRNKARELIRQSLGIKLVGEDIDISKLPKPESAVTLEQLETATFNDLQPSSELQGKYDAANARLDELKAQADDIKARRLEIGKMSEGKAKSKALDKIIEEIKQNKAAMKAAEAELNELTNSARREQYIEQGVNGLSSGLQIEAVPPKYRDEVIDRFNKAEEANIRAVKTVSAKKLKSAEKANSVNGLINEFKNLNPSSELSEDMAKLMPNAKQLEKANKKLQKQLDKANSTQPVNEAKVAKLKQALNENLAQLNTAKNGITALISRAETNQQSANMLSDFKNGKIAISDIKNPDVKAQVVDRYATELTAEIPAEIQAEITESIKELEALKAKISKKPPPLNEADIKELNEAHNIAIALLQNRNIKDISPTVNTALREMLTTSKTNATNKTNANFQPTPDIRTQIAKTLEFNPEISSKPIKLAKTPNSMQSREITLAEQLNQINAKTDVPPEITEITEKLNTLNSDLAANKAKLDELYGRTQTKAVAKEIKKALKKRKDIVFKMEDAIRENNANLNLKSVDLKAVAAKQPTLGLNIPAAVIKRFNVTANAPAAEPIAPVTKPKPAIIDKYNKNLEIAETMLKATEEELKNLPKKHEERLKNAKGDVRKEEEIRLQNIKEKEELEARLSNTKLNIKKAKANSEIAKNTNGVIDGIIETGAKQNLSKEEISKLIENEKELELSKLEEAFIINPVQKDINSIKEKLEELKRSDRGFNQGVTDNIEYFNKLLKEYEAKLPSEKLKYEAQKAALNNVFSAKLEEFNNIDEGLKQQSGGKLTKSKKQNTTKNKINKLSKFIRRIKKYTRKHRIFNQATMRRHLQGYRAF